MSSTGEGIGAGEVVVCSTGLIGERLPMEKLLPGVRAAVDGLSRDGGPVAAEAIMTTDTRPKNTVVAGTGWTVGGMAKGAGMLAPAMATMLLRAHHRRGRRVPWCWTRRCVRPAG